METNTPNSIDQETLNAIMQSPELERAVAKSAFEQMDNMFMFSEDEKAFAQREQLGHEDKARSFDLPGNLSYIPENDPVDTVAPALRPYGAILNELTEERSATATRHWKTKSGAMSKRTKEVQAVDETKVDELFDEVAAHVLLANPSESQDDKLEVLIDLQEKGNLSEADMTNIMDKMGAFEYELIQASNLVDEIVQEDIAPALEDRNKNSKSLGEFFKTANEDGKETRTPDYLAVDARIRAVVLNVENPLVRKVATQEASAQLQEAYDVALANRPKQQVAEKPVVGENLENKAEKQGAPAEPRATAETAKKELEDKINKVAESIYSKFAKKYNENGSDATQDMIISDAASAAKKYVSNRESDSYIDGLDFEDTNSGKAFVRGAATFITEKYNQEMYSGVNEETKQKAIKKELREIRNTMQKTQHGGRVARGLKSLRGKFYKS